MGRDYGQSTVQYPVQQVCSMSLVSMGRDMGSTTGSVGKVSTSRALTASFFLLTGAPVRVRVIDLLQHVVRFCTNNAAFG